MKKLSVLQMEKIEGGRPFWGWGDWNCGACDATGHQYCERTHYIFWIADSYDYASQQCVPPFEP